jgi:hypothetical protein
MIKIKDRILLGVVSGLIGAIPPRLINEMEYKKGLTDLRYNRICLSLFTKKNKDTSINGNTLAALTNGVNSSAIGILIAYLYSFTGRDHALIKGAGAGAFAWVILNGFVGSQLLKQKSKSPVPPILSFIDHLIGGGSVGYLVSKLGDDSLFPDTESLKRGEKLPKFAMNNEKAI